jgi:hypothetical protein
MKQKPENWKDLERNKKMAFVMGESTGVCWCDSTFNETCDKCKDLPDIKEEDRNYHEEMLLMLRHVRDNSRKPEIYSIPLTLYEMDEEESFNRAVSEVVENAKAPYEEAMENAYRQYHKTLRQYDHYNHLPYIEHKEQEFMVGGAFQSILYDLLHVSEVPYNMMKKLLSL